ncbi:aminoglycoside phosphotransferase family protein [Agromyces mediolanus]|uniref:aminoglycoside phosphotransferase family protein n=1 Tax=Agromyces mediolanus TaxID=41986 RepID=UPI001E2D3BD2|nr:aminoglycoside phosphotransferase family protein [Agromyces mediolanus]MCD1571293.1 aminoglycoside phosphotransferase family protein [Agromyces mediolanus]
MMDAPTAEIEIDEALAARLVAEQHPDLAAPVRLVANGWDNAMLRLGDDHLIRMPRRLLAARLVEHELRWLPELARHSPVALPVPVRAGAPSAAYPFVWSIGPWFDGVAAVELEPAARREAAPALAAFVASLQREAPADAPANGYRGVPLVERDPVVGPRIASGVLDGVADRAALERVWRAALAAPGWAGPPVWLHGDLHPGNLLLERADGPLAAVLDFGDVTAGDPATDLAAAWLCFDAVGRERFRAGLPAFSDADWVRARGWALAVGSAIVETVGVTGAMGRLGALALAELVSG